MQLLELPVYMIYREPIFTGGKWKPISPIQWSKNAEDRYWNIPPASHTGGKWKPNARRTISPSNTKGKWKPETPLREDDNIPPPSFTGSKWIASKRQDFQNVSVPTCGKGKFKPRDSYENDVPPIGYTKGNWKPRDVNEDIPPSSYTKGE